MTKGKPWNREEEQTLIQLVKKGKSIDIIAKALDKSEDAIFIKLQRLGLEVVEAKKNSPTTTSCSELPKDLPTVENVMKRLSAALVALETPDIAKKEIIRLRRLIQGFKTYKELFKGYAYYRDIETELTQCPRQFIYLLEKNQFFGSLIVQTERQNWAVSVLA